MARTLRFVSMYSNVSPRSALNGLSELRVNKAREMSHGLTKSKRSVRVISNCEDSDVQQSVHRVSAVRGLIEHFAVLQAFTEPLEIGEWLEEFNRNGMQRVKITTNKRLEEVMHD